MHPLLCDMACPQLRSCHDGVSNSPISNDRTCLQVFSYRDITYNATEFVLLLYHSVYGVFSSAFKIYFAHRVLYENE